MIRERIVIVRRVLDKTEPILEMIRNGLLMIQDSKGVLKTKLIRNAGDQLPWSIWSSNFCASALASLYSGR
jgi:hypothetical protein